MSNFTLHNGDCLVVLKTMADNSIDSVVTDPPYGLSFMGKSWDYDVPKKEIWDEVFRVLKPGGHLLSFFGSRTYHRGAVQIEDAGFEIRDQIMWLYGSGFPKSHDVSKGIDKAAGAQRSVVGVRKHPTLKDSSKIEESANAAHGDNTWKREWNITAATTDEAKNWEGWGTALKPAHEPIVVARKPLSGTVAANVLEHGTGAINIDGCRVEHITVDDGNLAQNPHLRGKIKGGNGGNIFPTESESRIVEVNPLGRWPANIIHDGSDEVVHRFPDNSNRFFYCAKASKADRDEGLEAIISKLPAAAEFRPNHMEKALDGESGNPYGRWQPRKNIHPTVKPTALMQYLCRLVTPKGGIVLDPFMGSGSTGKAAGLEGYSFVGIEMTKEYYDIAECRIQAAYWNKPSDLSQFLE